MCAPTTPTTKRTQTRTEHEYREWQLALQGDTPVKRLKNEPGFLTRLVHTIRHRVARTGI